MTEKTARTGPTPDVRLIEVFNKRELTLQLFCLSLIKNLNKDEDECQDQTHNCDKNAQCSNTFESFNCTCLQGYLGDGINCSDVDECQDQTHNCDVNAQCNNTDGLFYCTCIQGYSGDGVNCLDVDECQDQTHNCDVNAQCNNTFGSFNCVCLQGYSGDGVNCSGLMNHTAIYYSPHIKRAIVVVYLQS
ncbi:hypothetical protein ACROYT_G041531 [Oculina patagonica]